MRVGGGEWIGTDARLSESHRLPQEVVEPSRLVYDHISAPHHRTTVIFDDLGDGRTRLNITMIFDTTEKRWTVETFKADIGLKQTLSSCGAFTWQR